MNKKYFYLIFANSFNQRALTFTPLNYSDISKQFGVVQYLPAWNYMAEITCYASGCGSAPPSRRYTGLPAHSSPPCGGSRREMNFPHIENRVEAEMPAP
jgi:hypothetical protein